MAHPDKERALRMTNALYEQQSECVKLISKARADGEEAYADAWQLVMEAIQTARTEIEQRFAPDNWNDTKPTPQHLPTCDGILCDDACPLEPETRAKFDRAVRKGLADSAGRVRGFTRR